MTFCAVLCFESDVLVRILILIVSIPVPSESIRTQDVIEFKQFMSCLRRKPSICICDNKDADQLRGNREADQRLCFRYTDSTLHFLLKSDISSL